MSNPAAMTIANDQTIAAMIRGARRRVVFMAPGITRPIAQAIGEQWNSLGGEAIAVILDVDPEVCRMGYGEIEAIKHLEPIAASLGTMVNHHAGIRIGVVIADDETLIYAPTPLLIEAGPPANGNAAAVKPNAIRMSVPPADVERDLGLGLDGDLHRTIGLDMADKSLVKQVEADLTANPPQKFDITRSVRVFNAQFEFVEVEIKGASLERKTVRLPPHMLGLDEQPELAAQIEASVHMLHVGSPIRGTKLLEFRRKILARYCTLLPGYGYAVLRTDKPRLERVLARLAYAVNRFREQTRIDLRRTMDQTREHLARAIAPRWRPPEANEYANREYIAGRRIERVVRDELEALFGYPSDLIKGIRLNIVFKAVTYESLTDPKFCDLVRRRLPHLTTLHTEFDAAKGEPLVPPDDAQEELFKGAA